MAAEKQVTLEMTLLDTRAGEQDQAGFRGLSPFGKVPYLQEGDEVAIGAEAGRLLDQIVQTKGPE